MSEALHLEQVSAEQPWPGLMPFTEGAQEFFHGRDEEAAELHRLIRRETLTVLFGQSGLGKSSLLNAGLFPRLRAEDLFPVYVRLDVAAPAAPFSAQVYAALREACREHRVEAPAPRPHDTLWEFFHRKDADFWSARNRLLTPVLVFDQFEELFTLGRHADTLEERCRAFLQELADLAEDRLPASAARALEDNPAAGGELDFGRRAYKIVLSFREDYLPDFEGLRALMPSIMHNRMRLTRMNGVRAREAVLKPGARLVTEAVADQIVRFVASPRASALRAGEEEFERLEVEPALLSVVCRELNTKRIRARAPRISADLLTAGAQQQIIQEFYEASLAGIDPRVREFVEDQLLTEAGYRDSYALEDALQLPGLSMGAIDTLIARRLLRLEERSGVRRVELTHDVLTRVAKESRDQRQRREAEREARGREELRRRRVRRVALLGGAAGATALGLAVVFGVLLQRSNEERRRLVETQSNVLLEQAAAQLDQNVAGEAQAVLAESLRLNAANSGAAGRAVAYLSQRSFPTLVLRLQLGAAQGGERGIVRWHDAGTLAVRGASSVALVPLRAGAATRHLYVRGSGDGYENFGLAALAYLDGAKFAPGAAGALDAPDKLLPPSVKPVLAYDGEARSLAWSGHGSMVNLTDIDSGAKIGRALAAGRQPRAVTVSDDRSVAAWLEGPRLRVARTDGSRAHAFEPPGGARAPLALSSDGRSLIVGAGAEGEAAVYDLWSGQAPRLLFRVDSADAGARFTPDGRSVAANHRGKITLVELASGRARLLRHPLPVNALDISADGRLLATACQDKFARIWDLASGTLAGAPLRHDGAVLSAAFSPDGRHLVTGALDGTARVWSVALGELAAEPLVTGAAVADARISPDGSKALTHSLDGRVAVWQIAKLEPAAHSVEVRAVSLMEVAGPLIALAADREAREISLWQAGDAAAGTPRLERKWSRTMPQGALALRLSPDRRILAVATAGEGTYRVHLLDAASGAPLGAPLRHRGPVQAMRFSADGSFLATGAADGAARLWRVATQRIYGAPMLHGREFVSHVAFSPDGALLLTASGGELRVWSREDNVLLARAAAGGHVALADFAARDEVVAVFDNQVAKWRIEHAPADSRLVESARLEFGGVGWSAGLSPDRARLVVGRIDGTARVIDLASFRPLGQPMKSVGVVESVAFSADGRWVVTRSADRVARVWDSASGYPVTDSARHDARISGAALADGGAFFVTADAAQMLTLRRVALDFPAPAPAWLADLVQGAGGGRFDRAGTLVWIAERERELGALRERIGRAGADGWWQQWAGRAIERLTGDYAPGERTQ